jgi:hypothetical protein
MMSVHRGEAEIIYSFRVFRIWTQSRRSYAPARTSARRAPERRLPHDVLNPPAKTGLKGLLSKHREPKKSSVESYASAAGGRDVSLYCPATFFGRDQRKVVWSALVIRRNRTAPTVSACLRKSRTRPRQAADGAWTISSSHVSSTVALNLARSARAALAR